MLINQATSYAIDCNLLLNKGGNFQYQFSIFTKLNVYINTDLFTKKIHDKNCQTQLFWNELLLFKKKSICFTSSLSHIGCDMYDNLHTLVTFINIYNYFHQITNWVRMDTTFRQYFLKNMTLLETSIRSQTAIILHWCKYFFNM